MVSWSQGVTSGVEAFCLRVLSSSLSVVTSFSSSPAFVFSSTISFSSLISAERFVFSFSRVWIFSSNSCFVGMPRMSVRLGSPIFFGICDITLSV